MGVLMQNTLGFSKWNVTQCPPAQVRKFLNHQTFTKICFSQKIIGNYNYQRIKTCSCNDIVITSYDLLTRHTWIMSYDLLTRHTWIMSYNLLTRHT